MPLNSFLRAEDGGKGGVRERNGLAPENDLGKRLMFTPGPRMTKKGESIRGTYVRESFRGRG